MSFNIHYYYGKTTKDINDYATSYDSKAEAWAYIKLLAHKAIEQGMLIDLQLCDAEGNTLLTMVCDREIAYATRPNSDSFSGVTGFVVARKA